MVHTTHSTRASSVQNYYERTYLYVHTSSLRQQKNLIKHKLDSLRRTSSKQRQRCSSYSIRNVPMRQHDKTGYRKEKRPTMQCRYPI